MSAIRLARGCHRAQPGREVRRLLPRPRRRAAGRGGIRASRPSPCPTRRASPAPRRPRRSCCRTTTSTPSRRRSTSTAPTSPASSPRRPPATWARSPPSPGFNAGLRELTARHGALLIMRRGDDRIPGEPGRAGTASTPVDADLFTFGKVMSGGLPAAAFGGRADVMAHLAPGRAGLPGGHAVREPGRRGRRPGDAAQLHPGRLRRDWTPPPPRSADSSQQALDRGRRARTSFSTPGNLFSVFFTDRPVPNFDGASGQKFAALRRRSSTRCWTRRLPAA